MQSDITILATDKFDLETLLNKEKFFDIHLHEDNNGFLSLESARFEHQRIKLFLELLFNGNGTLNEIHKDDSIAIFDLTPNKKGISKVNDLDNIYQTWLDETQKEGSMDEYGMIMGFIEYINRNWAKQYLLLIADHS